MKKILLVAVMIAVLFCLFAVAISAAEIPDWTEITEVDGMPDKSVFGADGTKGATSRVLMSDGITYPAYYICNNSNSYGANFTNLNSKTGKSYGASDVVRIEVPKGTVSTPMSGFKTESGYTSLVTVTFPEGFTTLGSYTFKATSTIPSALVYVDFPSTLTSIGQSAFIDCGSLEELIIPEGVTTIPQDMARNTPSLKTVKLPSTIKTIKTTAFRSSNLSGGIVIPEGCTTVEGYAFKGCSLLSSVYVPSTITSIGEQVFAECPKLTDICCKSPTISKQMFYDCDSITNVTLENTVTIGEQAFCNPSSGETFIETLILPEGITSIGNYAFTRMQVTKLVIPSTLVTLGNNIFDGCKKLETVVLLGSTLGINMFNSCSSLKVLVLTENFTTCNSNAIGSKTTFVTYYTGTDFERLKTISSIPNAIKNAKNYSYEDYIKENYQDNLMVIYDTNLCVIAYGGVHTEEKDDGDCTTALVCPVCKDYEFKAAKTHISSERVTYISYLEKGEYYVGCTNDGCIMGTTEVLDALFICLGFSAPENGMGSITVGYMSNNEAIERYELLTGKTVKYGLFVVLKDVIGKNDIFKDDGCAQSGVISVEMSDNVYSIFELKITGLAGEFKDIKLATGAYTAINDGTTTEYSYLQTDLPSESEKYYFASYNDIIETLK